MKITFVYSDIATRTPGPWPGRYYHGIGYLSAFLKQAGHHTSLVHLVRHPISRERILAQLRAEAPDLVAFSSTSNAFPNVAAIAGWMREAGLGLPTVCGGVHPTLNPQEAVETPGIDYVCVGEGEEALLELCTRLEEGRDPTEIANIWTCHNGKVYQNAPRPLIRDLDSLPFPDREIFDYLHLYHQQRKEGEVIISRGCPYPCAYCCNQALHKAITRGKDYVRFRSVDIVIAEIQDMLRRYPFIHFLQFDDDLPFVKLEWTREFAEKYRQSIGLPFTFNVRPNLASRTQLELLKEANGCEVRLGLESGNEEIMNRVLNRNLTLDQVRQAFSICRDLGFRTVSYNMVGLPRETSRAVLDTIKLNAQLKTDICIATIFHPYKGTPLYDLCSREGFLTDKKVPDVFFDTILNLDTITHNQILFFHRYFRWLVLFYRGLYGLPGIIGKPLLALSDTLLAANGVARSLRYFLDPLARIKRKIVFGLRPADSLPQGTQGEK